VPGTAFITGLTGQDGSFVAELLLADGWRVVAAVRDPRRLGQAAHLAPSVELVYADLRERGSLAAALVGAAPQRVFHLAAPSSVPDSWQRPAEYFDAIAGSCAEILQTAAAELPEARVVVASSAAMFGDDAPSPQGEETPMRPASPYAAAKLAAHNMVGAMRAGRGLHASSAILFNHESPRRSQGAVSRRIARAAAGASLGRAPELELDSLGAVRDWSHARDIARGLTLIAAAERPADYVLARGEGHSVDEFARAAFAAADLDWDEYAPEQRSAEPGGRAAERVGDPRRARRELRWEPSVSFDELVDELVRFELVRSGGRRPAAT